MGTPKRVPNPSGERVRVPNPSGERVRSDLDPALLEILVFVGKEGSLKDGIAAKMRKTEILSNCGKHLFLSSKP